MTAQILRSTLVEDHLYAADGPVDFDLPVNPLSIVLLSLQPLNNTAGAPNNYQSVAGLLSMITEVLISYRGAAVRRMSLTDAAVLAAVLHGWSPMQRDQRLLDNAVREITVPICLGRRPYDPAECFPATRRGDLTMQLALDVAVTGLDGLTLRIETVELLEATPTRFIKAVRQSKPIGAVGEDDIELPIGNDLLGMLLYAPSSRFDANTEDTFFRLRQMVDNVETILAATSMTSLHGELSRRLRGAGLWEHRHSFEYDPTLLALTQAETRDTATNDPTLDHYGYVDYDPLEDGSYALRTPGAARVNLRADFEGAVPETARVIPVELVQLAGAAPAA